MEDNKELYFRIARDIQPKIGKILDEIRQEIIKVLGQKRIGIFGSYRDVVQGVKVKKIIDQLARGFANQGFTVITGIGIYMPSSVKTQLFKSFFKLLTTLEPKIALKDLYKYIVTFAPYAVFIETSSRSTSLFEEESFYDNGYFENILGVGFLVTDNDPLDCSYLKKKEINSIVYWLCEGTAPSNCEDNEGKCTFYELELNYATINMFVISEFMQLAITKDYHHIPTIMMNLIGNL